VIRWATVHAGPSVSAPTVRFYPVGTELHVIDYQHGWFQVLDPATSQRGWIYEKYYLQAISGPGQWHAVARNSPSPPRVALRVPKRPPLRRVKRPAPQQHQKIQPRIASETVASLLEKAFRGY
jgi:Bacterial SH3 domain